MKYKLINSVTKKETICDKVTIDGFDYYVSDAVCYPNDAVHSSVTNTIVRFTDPRHFSEETYKKVIATNNPTIDIPKVVDEIERLASDVVNNNPSLITDREKISCFAGWIDGYLKSQETHPFSEEDMVEFAEWVDNMGYTQVANGLYKSLSDEKGKLTKELLQLWKEQQPKTVYYA